MERLTMLSFGRPARTRVRVQTATIKFTLIKWRLFLTMETAILNVTHVLGQKISSVGSLADRTRHVKSRMFLTRILWWHVRSTRMLVASLPLHGILKALLRWKKITRDARLLGWNINLIFIKLITLFYFYKMEKKWKNNSKILRTGLITMIQYAWTGILTRSRINHAKAHAVWMAVIQRRPSGQILATNARWWLTFLGILSELET